MMLREMFFEKKQYHLALCLYKEQVHLNQEQNVHLNQSQNGSSPSRREWFISISNKMVTLDLNITQNVFFYLFSSSQSISEWLISIKKRMVYCNFSANDNHCVKHEIEIFYSSVEDGLNVKESNVLSLRTKKVCWLLFYSEQL
ncbi:unnamed protein product [Rotaria socialis]